MATPHDRSMNHDMMLGASDGTFKSDEPDRGGMVEKTTARYRHIFPWYYGVAEQPLENLGPR